MEINQISKTIVDCALRLHRDLTPGRLESVYEVVLTDLLKAEGLSVVPQNQFRSGRLESFLRKGLARI